jgi:hypothetical protein
MRWKSRLPFGDLRLGAEIIGLKGSVERSRALSQIACAFSNRPSRGFATGRFARLGRRGGFEPSRSYGETVTIWEMAAAAVGAQSRVKLVYCSGSGALAFRERDSRRRRTPTRAEDATNAAISTRIEAQVARRIAIRTNARSRASLVRSFGGFSGLPREEEKR